MKFLDLLGLEEFLDNLKNLFSKIGHRHKVADLEDYTVDSSFSATSTNPVQNKVINEALLTFANDVEKTETDISALNDEFDAHKVDTNLHVDATKQSNWNTAYSHSQANHARVDATHVESSTTNGNIVINGTETQVYRHPSGTNPHGTTKADVGLGNVDNTSDANKPVSTAQKAAIDAVQTNATNALNTHNASTSTHSDIRLLISNLTTKVNNFLDVDDTTTDQLSEILELIANNKGTLDSITSNKVNVSDIVDNLTTASKTKVLSANQGVALKALIDALQAEVDSKADETHGHAIADVSGLQSALDGKANSSHGTHVSFDSTNKPKMDGTAAFGTSTKVARADHIHPTDTSRAAKSELDALTTTVAGKADTGHKHAISDVTNLQSSLDAKQATITGGASSIASSNLTASRALVSDANGKVAVSAVTSTELGYLDGVTSAIQPQLDSKAASGHGHDAATTSAAGFMTAAMVTKLNGIATGANKTTVDTALSSTSTNPVQNKVVASSINTLTSAVNVNTSSINSHTTSIASLQTAIDEITVITSEEISALFA